MNRYCVWALALASLGSFSAAQACDAVDQKIGKILTPMVATYDAKGTFLADIKKELIDIKQTILECQDSPSLVKVALLAPGPDGTRQAWVSLLEVKVAGKLARKCQDQAISRVADTTTPATSGIDPCGHD